MRYVAYGSNLHPVRLARRTPSARLLGTSVVLGQELVFQKRSRDGSGKCMIRPVDGAATCVAVYRIDDEEISDLDRIEGVGAGYEVWELPLEGYGRCRTYVAHEVYVDASLKPYSWYRELVLVGCEYHEFPPCYIEKIGSLVVIDDRNLRRHEENMRIVQQARSGASRRTRRATRRAAR